MPRTGGRSIEVVGGSGSPLGVGTNGNPEEGRFEMAEMVEMRLEVGADEAGILGDRRCEGWGDISFFLNNFPKIFLLDVAASVMCVSSC